MPKDGVRTCSWGRGGGVLLLVACGNSSFWLGCLKQLFFFFFGGVFYVCIQVWTKLFCLKFFKGPGCLFWAKLVD